jgi:hypothetical protein
MRLKTNPAEASSLKKSAARRLPSPAAAPATVTRTLRVAVWPVWHHLCSEGGIRAVKLGRDGRALCAGCGTEAVYTKPTPNTRDCSPQSGERSRGGRSSF